jgi:NADH dehydrogenase [ubiquinone] 1 alpha subcomplex assembly factor 1
MFATPIRLAATGGQPGFWRRSLDELKRQSKIAVRLEGLHKPNQPFPLARFEHEDSLGGIKVMSDADMGGFSKASAVHIPGTPAATTSEGETTTTIPSQTPPHLLFAGKISTELPPNKPEIQRSGYAAWRTRDRGTSLFGKLLWDIDPYAFLALRIKSDGRKYFVNIQTESIVPTDLHQHLLPSHTPGEWETVTIPFSSFVRTNYGMVVEPQREMMRQKVRSVGIGLVDRVPGPFELCVADVWATNKAPERGVDSGFDVGGEPEQDGGVMGEVEPRRKKGEPERILI